MSPVLLMAVVTLPGLVILLIPFHDTSGRTDTRNGLAGLRTRQTLASREAWDAAHAWARGPSRRLAVLVCALLVMSVAAEITMDLSVPLTLTLVLGVPLVLVAGFGWITWRADRVAAEINRRNGAGR